MKVSETVIKKRRATQFKPFELVQKNGHRMQMSLCLLFIKEKQKRVHKVNFQFVKVSAQQCNLRRGKEQTGSRKEGRE